MAETAPRPGASKCTDEALRHLFGCERHDVTEAGAAAARRARSWLLGVRMWRTACTPGAAVRERPFEVTAENGRLFPVDERLYRLDCVKACLGLLSADQKRWVR